MANICSNHTMFYSYISMMTIAEEYKIIKPLGNQKKRKFGATYLVENKNTLDKAVLKASKEAKNSLLSEARFSFSYQGLPEVIRFDSTESESMMILKHVNGIELTAYWKSIGRKNRGEFLIKFLEKFESIFDVLRESQIVHADIKPSNILIETNGTDFNVHLIDFGLSFRQEDPPERKTLFPLGYAAPELLLNHLEIADHRTDLFALGNVIWQLYTGKLPLVHPNPSIFTNLQLTHPLPDHSEIPKGLLPILQKLSHKHSFGIPPNKMDPMEVRKILKKAMNIRYTSIGEAIDELKQLKNSRRFYQIRSFR